jgi:hypothetical protein
MAVTLNALTTGVGGLQTTGDTSGQISLQSNGSTVVAVTASGVTITGTLSSTTALPIASGGTGATTAIAAFDALNPMTTTGDIIYESTPSVAARLPIGTTGQILTVAGGLPSWAAAAAGGFTNMTVFASPGTFTTPSSTTKIKVTVVGGGGGSTSPLATAPSGGTSSFGVLASATGGTGGNFSTGIPGRGGAGSAGTLLVGGSDGGPGLGGSTILGGSASGANTVGRNYGGGGTGSNNYPGGGGGGAIYVGPVSASTGYAVTVGAGGTGTGSPNPTLFGGAGAGGVVVVEY